jgi:hypothetical protein
MSQPKWRRIANLGDVNPIDYGGYFVYIDTTHIYPPEAEYLESPDSDDSGEPWRIYRVVLDRCTFVGGVLSDNKFHPALSAWYADSIESIAATSGWDPTELIDALCGPDVKLRAKAYQAIASYHGWENFDSYPRTYAKRSELPRRIKRV